MKRAPRLLTLLAVWGVFGLIAAHGASLTWDGDTGTAGLQDGGGTWNTADTNRWWNGASYQVWNNATPDQAVFGVGSGAAGTVTLGVPITVGSITFNAPGSGNYTISGSTLTLSGSPTITVAAGQNATISSALAGTAFTKAGPGTLTLTTGVAATYSGTTVVSGGELRLGVNNYNILINHDVEVQSGATLYADSWAQNVRNVTLSGGTLAGDGSNGVLHGSWYVQGVTVPAGTGTSTISSKNVGLALAGGVTFNVGAGSQLDFTGTIWKDGGTNQPLIKTGDGVLRLMSTNSYTSGTTVNGGTVVVGATNALGTGSLTINSGTVSIQSPGFNALSYPAATITIGAGGTLSADQSVNNAHNLGPLTLNGGTLTSINGPAGPANDGANGNFLLRGVTVGGTSMSTISSTTLAIVNGSFDVNDVAAGNDLTISSKIISGSLTKNQAGTLLLTGANSFTGPTVVNAGVLKVGVNRNVLIDSATVTVQNGATLMSEGTAQHIKALTLNGGTLSGTGDVFGSWLFDQDVTVSGGANTSTISATNMAITPAAGITFTVGAGAASGIDLDVTGTFFNSTAGGMLNGGFTKAGPGVMRLNATSTHSGTTTVNGGTLVVGATNALGTGSLTINSGTVSIRSPGFNALSNPVATVTIGAGGMLSADQAANNAHNLGPVTLNGGTLTSINGPAGPANDGGFGNFLLRGVTVGGTSMSTISSTTLAIVSGSFDVNDVAIGPDLTISSQIISGTLTKNLAGTLVLTGANTSSGATTVNGGILQIGNGGSTGSVTASITDNATVVFNRGNAYTYSGIISGSGAVRQEGSGTLTLTGSNSYAGPTTVGAGTLSISADANLGKAPSSPSPGNVVINGGTLQATTSFSLVNNRGIALGPASGSGSGTIEVTGVNTLVYGGVLANNPGGTGGLTKTGTGKLIVAGASTYSGPTVIAEGTLQLVNNPVSASLPVGGATLWLDATDATKISGSGSSFVWQNNGTGNFQLAAAGGSAVTHNVSGAGPNNLAYVNLNGTSASGTTYLTLQDGSGAAATISDARTLFFVFTPTAQPGSFTPFFGMNNPPNTTGGNYMATSSGNGYVENSFSAGGLRTTGGAVWYENAIQLASPTTAPLNVGANNYRVVDVVAGSAVTFHNLGSDRQLGGRQLPGNIGEVLVYNTALTTAQRQAVEAYLMSKWLGITAPGFGQGSLPAGTVLQIGGGATLDLNGMSQSIASLSDYGGSGGTVTNSAAGAPVTLTIGTASGSTTFSGSIAAGTSAVNLVKTGASTQVLAGANTYTGATTINGGTLQVATGGVINHAAALTAANGTLTVSGGAVTAGGLYVGTGAGAGTVNISSGSLTSTGFVSIAGGAGPGTWNQTGGAVNITSQVNVGNLVGGGPAQVNISGGTFTQTGGIVYLAPWSPATMTISSTAAVSIATLQFGYSGSQAATLNLDGGSLRVANGVNYGGSGPATINFNGGTFQAGGSFALQAPVNTVVKSGGAVIDTAGNTLAITTPLTDGGGGGGLTKTGAGTLLLSGNNSYTGSTVISGGTLQIGNQAYLITTNTAGSQFYGGSLGYDFSVPSGKSIIVTQLGFYDRNLDGLTNSHTVTLSSAGGGTTYASATVPSGTTTPLSFGYRFTDLPAPLVLNFSAGNYTVWGDNFGADSNFNGAGAVAGPTDGGPNGNLSFIGPGRYGNSGVYPGSGAEAGPYRYGAVSFRYYDPTVTYLPSTTAVQITASGAALDLNGVPQTIGSLSGVAGSQVLLGSGTLTTGGSGASTTFAGAVSGSGGLVKNGGGTFTLSGNNTYTGATAVTAGKLLVNGSHTGGGLYSVASGATLGGTGSITAPVQLRGAMSPGASVGTFATGAETWFDGGSFTLELDSATGTAGASPGWDLLNVAGTLDLTNLGPGGFRVDLVSLLGGGGTNPGPLAGFSPAPYSSYYWDFVHASSISGFDAADFDLDLAAFTAHNAIGNSFGQGNFAVVRDGNNLVVTFTAAVPEPSTLALAGLALIGLLGYAWRRRARRGAIGAGV